MCVWGSNVVMMLLLLFSTRIIFYLTLIFEYFGIDYVEYQNVFEIKRKFKNARIMNIKNRTNVVTRTESLNTYLKEINKFKTLSKEEEQALFTKYENAKKSLEYAKKELEDADKSYYAYKKSNYSGETLEGLLKIVSEKRKYLLEVTPKYEKIMDDTRNEIISRNQRFVYAIAKRYYNGDTDLLLDVINEGNVGLLIAFDSYELSTGNRFCSYAVWYIRRQINHFLTTVNVTVRSTNNNKVLPKVKKIKAAFFTENGRYPTDAEIIDLLEKAGVVLQNESDINGVQMEYIDAAIGDDDDDTVLENSPEFAVRTATMNDYEAKTEDEFRSSALKMALSSLNDREKVIVMMSNGIGYDKEYTNKEIGERLNLCAERVRQIKGEAIKKLKASFNAATR